VAIVRDEGDVVELRLFGQAGLTANGAPVKLARRITTLSLLGYLVLHRGTPVSRLSLAYTLFPDDTEEGALAELRRYIYLTGKALPALDRSSWIRVDGETVQWNASAPCRVDVIEFEQSVGHVATRAQAVSLYAGDLLEEVYDDWVVVERERLRGLCLSALADLVATHREKREHSRALTYAHQLLALDPWREDIVRSAMSVRYEAGDSAGALAEFARFATRLREEMDVIPMPETLAVRDAVQRNEPLPGALIERLAPPENRRSTDHLLPFVGRRREVETLRSLWSRAARGKGGLALIHGEAGVGKTRLAAEIARLAEGEGGRVFVGATSTPESVPYQALVEGLRSALQLLRARQFPALHASALARLLPELQTREEVAADATAAVSDSDAKLVLDALCEAALALARPRPALIVLEDLHWAGRATLEAIAALTRRLEDTSLLIIGTYREDEVGPAHPVRATARALQAEGVLTTVPLERFDRSDVAEVVGRVEQLPHDDPTLVDRLVEYTEGNALFLSEAIADAIEREQSSESLLVEPSPGISSVIATRIARLSERSRTVVEVVAVAGAGCSVEVVSEVVALPASDVWAALNELLDRRILREASARSGVDFAFAHHLIGQSIYEGLDSADRIRRHARIAHVLERVHAERPGAIARELAQHFERAGLLSDAARWFGEAARTSAALYAGDDTIALATKALTIESDPGRRVELLRLREEARARTGDRAGQRTDIDLLERELAGGDNAARFDLLRRRALLARSLGESDDERTVIEQMLDLAGQGRDARLRAEALRQRATHAVMLSRQVEAREPAAEALALFESLGDVPAQIECLGLLVDAETNGGNLERARGYLNAMQERSSTLADRAVHARALTIAAIASLLRLEYKTAQDLSYEVLAIATTIGDRDMEAHARARIAVTAARLDDFDLALAEFERALEMFEALRNKRGLAVALTNKTMLAMRLGLFADALTSIKRSDALIEVVQERRMAVANGVNASFVKLRLGDAVGALRLGLSALDEARAIGFPVFEAAALANVGNAERALGRLDDAIAHMQAGIDLRRPIQEPGDFADDLSDLTIALAEAGRAQEARAVADELTELLHRSTTGPLWVHYVAWAVARGLAAGGDAEAAAAYERRALDELKRFAASIKDESVRKAFLSIDVSREIAASAHADGTSSG
jgi:DNA-binding SARP family transcriptional activator/tetratricopeptide (TPR) repeat protein